MHNRKERGRFRQKGQHLQKQAGKGSGQCSGIQKFYNNSQMAGVYS